MGTNLRWHSKLEHHSREPAITVENKDIGQTNVVHQKSIEAQMIGLKTSHALSAKKKGTKLKTVLRKDEIRM